MKDKYKYGVGFWAGGGIYSLINLILNFNGIPGNKILSYDYLITGVAVAGLVLNVFLLMKDGRKHLINTLPK